MTSGDRPAENAHRVAEAVAQAAEAGCDILVTPEVTNCVSADRAHQSRVLQTEDRDPVLAAARAGARAHGVWVCLGSLALKPGDEGGDGPSDGRFVNRSILLDPHGRVRARYDKIHMFDVDISASERFRESASFRPGRQAVVAHTPLAAFGMTICYDLRFPHLYRTLAKAGAEVLLVPAAFSPTTGRAHWEPLLRARAIENGAFVLAPAQTGTHPAHAGRARQSYGHSLVVSPWGEVRLDGGVAPGLFIAELDLAEVAEARRRVPSLVHDQPFSLSP